VMLKSLLKVKAKTVFTALFFFFVIFCLAGGPQMLYGLSFGFNSVREARFGVTAPFYAGFLFTGFVGVLYALNNFRVRGKCLLGFGVLGFSFLCIEVLYVAVVGR
jgi:hypothetical protein